MSHFCGQKLRVTDTGFTGFVAGGILRMEDAGGVATIAGFPLLASQV
jgi:hypothetical protein